MRLTSFHIASLSCISIASVCMASTVVKEYNSGGSEIAAHTVGSSDTSISLNVNTRFVDILPADNSTDIPRITFTGGPSTGVVSIYLGADDNSTGPDFNNSDIAPSRRGRNLKGIVATGLAGTTISEFYGGITGDFGQTTNPDEYYIYVDHLVRFDAGGAIRGNFEADAPGGTSSEPVFVIEGDGFSDLCDISLANGTITRIKATNDMKAQITVANGDISLIDAGARITGYGPDPILVKKGRIKKILAAQEISQFTAQGLGEAMIRANEGTDFIETPFIDSYIIANDTAHDTVTDGSIRHIKTTDSSSGIRTHATIVASKIISDSTNDGRVTVSGSLNGELVIGNSGLTGQVIINAANGSGTWSDRVTIGSVELSTTSNGAPYYTVASSSLGGGAVGLVPYHLYPQDMTYPSGSTFFDSAFNHRNPGGSSGNNRTITLRFYGPVFQNDTDPAIKIEQDLGSWVDVTNRAVITFGSATSGNPREITIHGTDGTTGKIPFLPGTYRITRVAGELKCQGTSASPAPDVYEFTYSFTLDVDCNKNNIADATDLAQTVTYGNQTYHPYDMDDNGHIDVCDREANNTCAADIDGNGFINGDDYDWFAILFEIGHPLADITFDGFVNGDDYDLFSEQYENGCP
ncbi:MAG: hypothetical protein JNL50_06290 [Phycisphaerae bacterium]|nr:hypothetical protein [Phycisphaerae bacterium]